MSHHHWHRPRVGAVFLEGGREDGYRLIEPALLPSQMRQQHLGLDRKPLVQRVDVRNRSWIAAIGQRLGIAEHFQRGARRSLLTLPDRPGVFVSAFHVANLSNAA